MELALPMYNVHLYFFLLKNLGKRHTHYTRQNTVLRDRHPFKYVVCTNSFNLPSDSLG